MGTNAEFSTQVERKINFEQTSNKETKKLSEETMNSTNNDSSDESTDEEETIRDFEEEAPTIINQLSAKSANRYNLVYETFLKWKDDNKADSFEETVFISYFNELQKKGNPNTLWSVWSMLKKMLNMKHNIDINTFHNLKAILKNNSKGHKSKKSLAFTWDEIMTFIKNADDHIYLGAKVLLIFGICGALRCSEFTNMKYTHVQDKNDIFVVSVQDTKTYVDRRFIIKELFYPEVKKYISLRPSCNFTDKFFIKYSNGRCARQVIGKNKIGSTPFVIASFLGLKNSSKYTGHSYRRTSATLFSNSGANMTIMKQLGGWKSDTVAAGYATDSMITKDLIFQDILHESKTNNTDALFVTPSTRKYNRTNTLLIKPSTSKEDSLNGENQIDPLAELSSNSVMSNRQINSQKLQQYWESQKAKTQLLQERESLDLQHSPGQLKATEVASQMECCDKQKQRDAYNCNDGNKNSDSAESHDKFDESQPNSRDSLPNAEQAQQRHYELHFAKHRTCEAELSNIAMQSFTYRNASENVNSNFERYHSASGNHSNSRTSISNTANGTLNTSIWTQIKEVQSEIGETTAKLMKLHKKLQMLIKLQDNHTRVLNETSSVNESAKKNVENEAESHSSTDEIMEVAIKNEIDSEESEDLNTVETVWFPELDIKNEDDSRGSLDLINTEETDWLIEVSPLKSPYYPQIDDLVMYFPQGYQCYLQAVKKYQIYDVDELVVPFMDLNLTAHQLVKVVSISYENYPPRVSRLLLQPINENGDVKGDSFEVSYHNINGVVDFLIQKHLYDASMKNNWSEGDRFRCTFEDDLAFGYVESIEPYNEKFPDSVFKRYRVRFDDDTEVKLSPWELESIDNAGREKATLYKCQREDWIVNDKEVNKEKIMECLQEVVKLPIAKPFLNLNKDASYTSFARYPIDLLTILTRFENNFYRRVNSLKFDFEQLAANIEEIRKNPNSVNVLSKGKKDNFKNYKIINEVLLTILDDPENIDVYDLHEHLKESQEENSDDTSINYEPPVRLQESLHFFSDNESSRTCKTDWVNACKVLFDKILNDEDSQPFRNNTCAMNLDHVNECLKKDIYISPSAFYRDMGSVFSSSKYLDTQAQIQEDRLRKMFNSEMDEIISSWKANRKFKDLSEKLLIKRKTNSLDHLSDDNMEASSEKRQRTNNDEAEEIKQATKNVCLKLLPEKSRKLYIAAYNTFKEWCTEKGSNSFCQDVLLSYFDELSKKYAPSSLWATYSMLKCTINTYNQIDIGNYKKLLFFLRQQCVGYRPKKSPIFSKEHISKFLCEAPDDIYLCEKVVLIFGIAGSLRREELANLSINDVKNLDDSVLLINIHKDKNYIPRSFTVRDMLHKICLKYMQARPKICEIDRFFLRYAKGKCVQQPIGINKFATMPRDIASFLNLPDANDFTAYSLRKTPASVLIDASISLSPNT